MPARRSASSWRAPSWGLVFVVRVTVAVADSQVHRRQCQFIRRAVEPQIAGLKRLQQPLGPSGKVSTSAAIVAWLASSNTSAGRHRPAIHDRMDAPVADTVRVTLAITAL